MTEPVNIDQAKTHLSRRTPGTLHGKIRTAPDFDETPDEIIDTFYGEARTPSRPHGATTA